MGTPVIIMLSKVVPLYENAVLPKKKIIIIK